MSTQPAPVTTPCKCGRMATLFEGRGNGFHSWQIRCGCGIEGAVVTYKKRSDRERAGWAALDGWRINNGSDMAQ